MSEASASKAFVVGWPIAHSRSPLIHGYWLKLHGIAGSYERIAVEPTSAEAFFAGLGTAGFVGGNVTVPHKETAFRMADRRDSVAEMLQAVNTLWMEEGKLCATNTDAEGFIANLDASAPGWDNASKSALVLGAGGAARAVIWSLLDRGLEVHVANRNRARADDLQAHFKGVRAHGWDEVPRLLARADVLVNTTPLGMEGKDSLALDLSPLSTDALVTDIVYAPLITPLLRLAMDRGNRIVDGLGMLLHQAVPGFERWFGVRPEVTPELRALIVADLAAHAA
jgi:shikimate dehydrogenase